MNNDQIKKQFGKDISLLEQKYTMMPGVDLEHLMAVFLAKYCESIAKCCSAICRGDIGKMTELTNFTRKQILNIACDIQYSFEKLSEEQVKSLLEEMKQKMGQA